MAVKARLKRLIFRISNIRIVSKKKQEDRKLQEACNQEALALEKIRSQMVGSGKDGASSSHEASAANLDPRSSIDSIGSGTSRRFENPGRVSYHEDIDPRFITNPIGIGSSRSFEKPPAGPTEDTELVHSASILTAFRRFSVEYDNAKHKDRLSASEPQESVFDPSLWAGPASICINWTEGKGKGRANEAEMEDIGMMRHWLAHDESGNVMAEDEATGKLLAFMAGKAWTI